MKMLHYFPLFSLATLSLLLVSSTAARPAATTPKPASPPLPPAAKEFLKSHNKARAEVGVEPLQWSEKLAKDTSLLVRYQRNKMACGLANLTASKYGGNQLWVSIGEAIMPSSVVEVWVSKKELYIHANNTCVNHEYCWPYMQVVWKKSVQLGCSQATCTGKKEAGLTICFYDPPAPSNVIGDRQIVHFG